MASAYHILIIRKNVNSCLSDFLFKKKKDVYSYFKNSGLFYYTSIEWKNAHSHTSFPKENLTFHSDVTQVFNI